jgi:hypothetical protein
MAKSMGNTKAVRMLKVAEEGGYGVMVLSLLALLSLTLPLFKTPPDIILAVQS